MIKLHAHRNRQINSQGALINLVWPGNRDEDIGMRRKD